MDAEIAHERPRAAERARRRGIRFWLLTYAVALALVAFWPTPVDRDAGDLLDAISRAVPWLTYDVIETVANVLLFVPLGALLALVLRRWAAVLAVSLATTLVIELGQALLLTQRTPSLRDVVANLCGAALGLAVVRIASGLEGRRSRMPRRYAIAQDR